MRSEFKRERERKKSKLDFCQKKASKGEASTLCILFFVALI
jgi:hypothetical protein